MMHEWTEPVWAGTFCVHCGGSPLTRPDLEPCPAQVEYEFSKRAWVRWEFCLAMVPTKEWDSRAAEFRTLRLQVARMN